MFHENQINEEIVKFVEKTLMNIGELSAEELIHDSAINPFLVKALGIDDFDSLAKFYVYQRVGRSLVTSFGTTIERIICALSGGEKAVWWDIKAEIHGQLYYMCIKSGPRDMDKDQVVYFANQVRKLVAQDSEARAIIAMGYGKKPVGVIAHTLSKAGLDVDEYTLTGKQLYDTITGETDYHKKLLRLIKDAALNAISGEKIIDIIDAKVKEITDEFKNKYPSVDHLLLDIF